MVVFAGQWVWWSNFLLFAGDLQILEMLIDSVL